MQGIPYALHQSGFGLGMVLLILVAVLTDYSLILMVRSGHLCGEMSYQGLMRASFGRPGFYILTALQFIYPFIGKSIVYLLTLQFKNKINYSPDFDEMATFLACNASVKLPILNQCQVRMRGLFHYSLGSNVICNL